MRYAYYPGCVAKSSAPELYDSTALLAQKLGIELVELTAASCCGAGVLDEGNPFLEVLLNARTFAQAEALNLDILTICSTCQGVMRKAKWDLDQTPSLAARVNEALDRIGLKYEGKSKVKHLLWALVEDYGLQKLTEQVTAPLKGLRIAPFYGCYLLRPPESLRFESHEKPSSLEQLIVSVGGELVYFEGQTKCCGFPIVFVQRNTAFDMAATYLGEAKQNGAQVMVTPCPLCHISLDLYQKKAAKQKGLDLDIPVLHLSQLVGLAFGFDHKKLGLSKHMISIEKALRVS